MKSWLVITSGPFCGTERYYCAFSDISPIEIEEVNDWFWNEETYNLWDEYSFYNDDEYAEELDSWDGDEEEFWEQKQQEWQEDCNIEAQEMSLKDLQDYIPGGPKSEDDLPEIIYDGRNDSTGN